MKNSDTSSPFRSAFIALIGRPNSGKSTLLNTIIGEEISIATALPQTTRSNARGIYTTDTMQLIFVDTPGIHKGKHTFNKVMFDEAKSSVSGDVDLICYVIDLSRDHGEEETIVADIVRSVKNIPVLLVFNKTDLVPSVNGAADRYLDTFNDLAALPSLHINATDRSAKEIFLNAIDKYIPEGPLYFDPEDMTDATMRQVAAEYIRKHIIAHTSKEVPHAVFVEIESYREHEDRHEIIATIHVETRGQRGIIIGKAGKGIDRIKRDTRRDLKNLLDIPVSLTCHIKVTPRWRDNHNFLRHMGISVPH